MMDDFKRPETRRPRQFARPDSMRGNSETSDSDVSAQPAAAPSNPLETFRTPEEVSRDAEMQDHLILPAPDPNPQIEAHSRTPRLVRFKTWLKQLSKKQWALIIVLALLLIGGGTAAAIQLLGGSESAPVAKTPAKTVPPPKPKPIYSPLSGLQVTEEVKARPVTGVMIENSTDSRPQSGIDQASVVFEAIAEGGITRFLCLYQDNYPGVLGPVRSARPYYLDWVMSFDANYAHVGGSPDALQRIKEIGVRDLDQFQNAGAYHRISTRFAPHNMYTSLEKLAAAGAAKGYTSSTFTPLARKEKETPSKAPTAKSINFAISSPLYNVHYDYDAAQNVYRRSMAGNMHTDNETGQQLSPKVVVAMALPYSTAGKYSQYLTIGSGSVLIFQDGDVFPGTWEKAGLKDQFVFKDAAGKQILLNPGQTWFTVLKDISEAQYQP